MQNAITKICRKPIFDTPQKFPKIDTRKSIISRIERVTNPSESQYDESHGSRLCPSQIKRVTIVSVPKLMDRTGHDCVSKLDERFFHTGVAAPLGTARLDHASIEGRRRCSQTRGAFESFVGQLASCSEWRCSIRPESQGESLGQFFICNCLCIGLTDSVLSSGPIVLTVPQKLIPGRSRRKSSSATESNLQQLGSSRSVC